ncbi:MAG TPA: hypothetical protein VNB24_02705 [Acidimicrobiales bacterium]|nr:hypothetical protein [Acidimicrobiales bacterium]
MDERELERLAAKQHSLLTSAQCRVALGPHWRSSRLARSFEPVHARVVRLRGSPHSWLQDLAAACLAIAGAVASHRSAGRLHRLNFVPAIRLEVTIARRTGSRVRGVILHRSNKLPDSHVTVIQGVPVTTLARTLVDLSAVVSPARLGLIVDDARRRGLITYAQVQEIREELRARGRRRTRVVDRVLGPRLESNRLDASRKEKVVAKWLRDAGLHAQQQVKVIIKGKARYLDFGFLPEKVGLEYQGFNDHTVFGKFTDDQERTSELQLAGWMMLFFSATTTRATALRQVREALAMRRGG